MTPQCIPDELKTLIENQHHQNRQKRSNHRSRLDLVTQLKYTQTAPVIFVLLISPSLFQQGIFWGLMGNKMWVGALWTGTAWYGGCSSHREGMSMNDPFQVRFWSHIRISCRKYQRLRSGSVWFRCCGSSSLWLRTALTQKPAGSMQESASEQICCSPLRLMAWCMILQWQLHRSRRRWTRDLCARACCTLFVYCILAKFWNLKRIKKIFFFEGNFTTSQSLICEIIF